MRILTRQDAELEDKRNLVKMLSGDYPHSVYSPRRNTYGFTFDSRHMEDGLVDAASNAVSEAGYNYQVEFLPLNKLWYVWIGEYSPKNSGENSQ